MQAKDLAEKVPSVHRDTTGAEAARVVAEYHLTGLVVEDDDGVPIAVIPGSQLMSLLLPPYLQDDPALAHVLDEQSADRLCSNLNHATIGQLLDARRLRPTKPPSVLPDDTLVEIASAMTEARLPLILVRDADGTYHGAIMMSRALAAVAAAAGQDSERVRQRLQHDLLPDAAESHPAASGDERPSSSGGQSAGAGA